MSIVREFERAFNRQDVPALVACFTPDGSYHDTFFGGHTGPDGLRSMFERMFREGRDYRWTMETVVETDAEAKERYLANLGNLQDAWERALVARGARWGGRWTRSSASGPPPR